MSNREIIAEEIMRFLWYQKDHASSWLVVLHEKMRLKGITLEEFNQAKPIILADLIELKLIKQSLGSPGWYELTRKGREFNGFKELNDEEKLRTTTEKRKAWVDRNQILWLIISALVDAGVQDKAAMAMLGVKSDRVIKTYLHLKESKLRTEAMKLGSIL